MASTFLLSVALSFGLAACGTDDERIRPGAQRDTTEATVEETVPANKDDGRTHDAEKTTSQEEPVITGISWDFDSHQRDAVNSDNWPATWSDDDHQYAFGGDGTGFCGFSEKKSWMVARIEGSHDNWNGVDVQGGDCAENQTDVNGKTHGAPISIGGDIYWWLTPGSGANGYVRSTLWKSTDKMSTIQEVDPQVRFTNDDHGVAYLGFVNRGQDDALNDDGFVYVISTEVVDDDGFNTLQDPGRFHLLRVPVEDIEDQSQYEWFTGFDSDGNATWGGLDGREPIYETSDGVGAFPQLQLIPEIDRYVLTLEHTETNASNLRVLEGPNPWGPWNEIHNELGWGSDEFGDWYEFGDWHNETIFQWQFAPKWFRDGGRDFTMVFSGFGGDAGMDSWNTIHGRFQTRP